MRFDLGFTIPQGWAYRPIADICSRITSGGTPSRKRPEYYEGGDIPWVKTKELEDGWIIETEETLTDEAISNSSAKLLPENTVLMAMYGATVGKLGILSKEMACNQACCAMIVDPRRADYRYLFYLLLNQRQQIKSLATGAAQQNLSASQIKDFEFPFPDLGSQALIAGIIGELDDKIELNRQINRALEQIAQAIFKSWFVDFEPVKAKQHIRTLGGGDEQTERAAQAVIAGAVNLDVITSATDLGALDQQLAEALSIKLAHPTTVQREQLATIASQFSDQIVESELGLIPGGWGCLSIDDLGRTVLGGTPSRKKEEFWGGSIPWINSGAVNQARVISASEYLTQAGYDSSSTKLMPIGTTLIAITGATMGQISRLEIEACGNQSIVGVIPDMATSDYLYLSLCNSVDRLMSKSTGAAQQHINKNDVNSHRVVYPGESLDKLFSGRLKSIFELVARNAFMASTLTDVRDVLLPRLLSGELMLGQGDGRG